jgi:hypothetical protein
MSGNPGSERRRGVVRLSELLGRVVDPVIARRGFATLDLIAAWPAVVGPAFADCTQPERVLWPRGPAAPGATLVVRVDGPRALFLQHELPQILERVNALLGHGAVARIRIAQGVVAAPTRIRPPVDVPLPPAAEARLAGTVGTVASGPLRAALDRLGRGVLAGADKRT